MENETLTGIERELVLQYLIDGNVPVTVSPIEEKNDLDEIRPLSFEVFPVAIKAENISILKEGIILLKNTPKSVSKFKGKKVKVEFYFNRVGLFFISEMKSVSSGPALVIPACIYRIHDTAASNKYDFSANVYYSLSTGKEINSLCVPADGYELFTRPVWSTIKLEFQKIAKSYLEKFVVQAKVNNKAGNGIQLIPICRYVVEKEPLKMEAVEGRVKPFDILFVNHERIVLASKKKAAFEFYPGEEYALKMSFTLKETPVITRDIFATCKTDNVYKNNDSSCSCADCIYTSIQEEDLRFLFEKATKTLFD